MRIGWVNTPCTMPDGRVIMFKCTSDGRIAVDTEVSDRDLKFFKRQRYIAKERKRTIIAQIERRKETALAYRKERIGA